MPRTAKVAGAGPQIRARVRESRCLPRPFAPWPKAPRLLEPQDRLLERATVGFGQIARVAGPGALPSNEPVGPQQVGRRAFP